MTSPPTPKWTGPGRKPPPPPPSSPRRSSMSSSLVPRCHRMPEPPCGETPCGTEPTVWPAGLLDRVSHVHDRRDDGARQSDGPTARRRGLRDRASALRDGHGAPDQVWEDRPRG